MNIDRTVEVIFELFRLNSTLLAAIIAALSWILTKEAEESVSMSWRHVLGILTVGCVVYCAYEMVETLMAVFREVSGGSASNVISDRIQAGMKRTSQSLWLSASFLAFYFFGYATRKKLS